MLPEPVRDPGHRHALPAQHWEVLDRLIMGLTNAEMGRDLDLSLDGVKSRMRGLLARAETTRRHGAVAWAYRGGLYVPDLEARADRLDLSPRTWEVMCLVVQGRSRPEVAREMYLSADTVRTHVSRIMRAWKVDSLASVTALAWRAGVV